MRKLRLIGGIVVATLLALIAFLPRPATPPPSPIATAPIPEPAPQPPEPVPAPPEPAALPALPTREVAIHQPRAVPEDAPVAPAKPFSVQRSPALPPSAAGPKPGRGSAAPARATPLAGAAQVEGATRLVIGGHAVTLFGIRPPSSGDRCAAPSGITLGTPPQCADKAHDALAARLARNPDVSCRITSPGNAAICLDAEGVDLAGFLVSEGLALADPAQSRDYVGAEDIARAQRRGLWRSR